MKTQKTPITELQPGDKLYVPWTADHKKTEQRKLPDVVTVKEVLLPATVNIKETGGLCLLGKEFNKVIPILPEAGDTITFDAQSFNETIKGCLWTTEVKSLCLDPLKKREPKCIVTVDGENYGIPFSEIKSIQKKQPHQLSIF